MMRAITIGIRSVRANLVPMAVLWAAGAALAVGYYRVPAVAAALEPLARWQTENGWGAAFMNRVVFCGLLPGAFLLSVNTIRPPRVGAVIAAYCLWAGLFGILCDGFFTFQTWLFGSGRDMATLVKKTLVDQLLWNVFLCTPANALFFPWVARDFRRGNFRGFRAFVADDCAKMLFANWITWIPVMVAVYAFPLPLQIQLTGFAGAFWMLVALWAGKKGKA